ncbi:TPA: winged helix-turn-helix transcriptional regulator [Candidatus Woesearchaeota archaeon]|nr:winged helix-turn-helix transcriptional regulator [Candidatus Woesearchaeota archaeon]
MRRTGDDPLRYGAYAIFFETLANQNRLHIINSLRAGRKNVSQIIDATGLEQTCVSHCLKRLENCGFVSVERDGKFRIYTLNSKTIEPLMRLIDTHTGAHCIHLIEGDTCTHRNARTTRKKKA